MSLFLALIFSSAAFAQTGADPGAQPSSSLQDAPAMYPRPTATPNVSPDVSTETGTKPKTESSKASDAPAAIVKPNPGGVVSITKIVGEVGDDFITSREVKINNAIDQALTQKPLTPESGYKILAGSE